MKIKVYISIITFSISTSLIVAQEPTYTVAKAPFSSDKYDEYSPVFYNHGIVFTSNRGSGSFVDYSSSGGKGTFDISFIDTTGKITWKNARSFSKSLATPFNDGPVTFNRSSDTIYFSRNLQVEGSLESLSNVRNKLGIFSAVQEGNGWTKIRDMRFNNEWYNVTTPWLSNDGKKLYFASDRSGGYGGSDLYYSQWKNDYWSDPVNLGPIINTPGNEAYPFLNPSGDLYFASDGHPGMGGKDIFYSRFADTAWLPPVHIDPPVNSENDDFGIITDSVMKSGYFSSNRGKSTDIYFFKTNTPQIFYSMPQRENQYCFKFTDQGKIKIDNNLFRYEWDFGDGSKASGQNVNHCFPGPGTYMVKSVILEKSTGRIFFNKLSYKLELKDVEQPYINSPDVAVAGEEISLDGRKSNLPGYEILAYYWQFGTGERTSGESTKHVFKDKGIQEVKLGLTIRNRNTGITSQRSISKRIEVFGNDQELKSGLSKIPDQEPVTDILSYDHASVQEFYSAEHDVSRDAEFIVEVMNSKSRIPVNNLTFRNLPGRYSVTELFLPDDSTYSYIVDREMDLMMTLTAYNDMISLGNKNTRIRTYIPEDPAEMEIHSLKKIFGMSSDIYFDSYNRLTSSAYLLLDQLVRILNKYPENKLELAVHTDKISSLSNGNIQLSQGRARTLVNYLISKGIDPERLIATGKGGERPVATNFTEGGRKLNRRIDFTLIKD